MPILMLPLAHPAANRTWCNFLLPKRFSTILTPAFNWKAISKYRVRYLELPSRTGNRNVQSRRRLCYGRFRVGRLTRYMASSRYLIFSYGDMMICLSLDIFGYLLAKGSHWLLGNWSIHACSVYLPSGGCKSSSSLCRMLSLACQLQLQCQMLQLHSYCLSTTIFLQFFLLLLIQGQFSVI